MTRALILAALLVAAPFHVGSPVTATTLAGQHQSRYRPDVRVARQWLRERMPRRQFRCLHRLIDAESSWRVRARGPMTSWGRAYGLPQALPGRKMRSAERPRRGERWDDWHSDALVQSAWAKTYIKHRYGTACAALRFQSRFNYY